jgi:DMSO/TMAO reductase YedYZ molybdopterin-dependent catalytic subunit
VGGAARHDIRREELALAARNHGMPLEALRLPVTPIGLHYLLSHYDIPILEAHEWQLEVGGLVQRPLTFSLDEILAHPAMKLTVTMECAGNGRAHLAPRPFSQPWLEEAVGTARWTGTPLGPLLRECGLRDGAVEVVFTGLDRGFERGDELVFERSLPLEQALADDVLLAWAINGQPLPPQHGFPLRLLVPGWYGMASVKWLTRITVVDRPFTGPQQSYSYRLRQTEEEEGEPLTRMLPRALMIPPGIPEFPTRARSLVAGACVLEGRAWSGFAPVEQVDVSVDGGRSWQPAELDSETESPYAWQGWRHGFEATPGATVLMCRATDGTGRSQPLEPVWNLSGYANNAVQRVPVTVV